MNAESCFFYRNSVAKPQIVRIAVDLKNDLAIFNDEGGEASYA